MKGRVWIGITGMVLFGKLVVLRCMALLCMRLFWKEIIAAERNFMYCATVVASRMFHIAIRKRSWGKFGSRG